MFKSKIARVFTLGAGATIAVLLAFGASQAQAATGPQMTYVPQYQFNAGVGRCFLPQNAFGGSGIRYTEDEVDILAAYIIPEKEWWIIPLSALEGSRSAVLTHTGRLAQYCEAWHLLRGEGSFGQRRASG